MTAPIRIYEGWGKNKKNPIQLQCYLPESVQVNFELGEGYSASFTAYNDGSDAFYMLNSQNSVIISGQEYVIKQLEPDYTGGVDTYNVTLVHVFNEAMSMKRQYNSTDIRWKDASGKIQNPNAENGRTADMIDTSKTDDEDADSGDDSQYGSASDTDELTNISIQDFVSKWKLDSDQEFGKFVWKFHGDFPNKAVSMNQDMQFNEAIDALKEAWSDVYIIPDNFTVNVYTDKELFKDNGNRIDYLHDTSEVSLTYDTTELSNGARLVGATYTLTWGGGDGDGTGGNLDSTEGFAKSPINADFGVDVNRMKSDFASRSWKVKVRGVDVNRLYDVVKQNGVSPEWFFAYELMEQGTTFGWLNHTYAHGDPYQDAEYVCGWIKQIANSDTLNPAWTAAEGAIGADAGLTARWNQEFGKGTIGRVYLQGTAAAVWELAGTSGNASMGKPMAGCVSVIKGWGGHTNSGATKKAGGWSWPFPDKRYYNLGVGYKFGYDGGFRQNSYHDGTDWSNGTYSGDVHAIHPGVVTLVDGYNFGTGSGRIVVKGDDGYTVVYQEWTWSGSSGAHVSVGQRINIGDVICTLQASHVHIGVTTKDFNTAFSNSFSDAGGWVDPIPLIQKGGGAVSATKTRANEVIEYAKRFIGLPYVWGGPSGDGVHGTDCSGLVNSIYAHFGLKTGGRTTWAIKAGASRAINRSEVATGDVGLCNNDNHIVFALDNKTLIQESQPGEPCNTQSIDGYYYPVQWFRYDDMHKLVGSGAQVDGSSGGGSSSKSTTVSYFTPFWYQNEASVKQWGVYAQEDITSDTITTEAEMKKFADTQFHLNPEFSMEVTLDKDRALPPMGDVTRVEIKDAKYTAKLKMVGYTDYPCSMATQSTVSYNSKPESILDFYNSQRRALTDVQTRIKNGLEVSKDNKEWLKAFVGGETSDQTKQEGGKVSGSN